MKCGECLAERVEVVELNATGKCPKCGTDYSDYLADLTHNNKAETERHLREKVTMKEENEII